MPAVRAQHPEGAACPHGRSRVARTRRPPIAGFMLSAALVLVTASATSFAQRPSPAQLSAGAWKALNAGHVREAVAAFDDALKTAPEEPSLLLGAGLAAHL